MPKSKTEPKVRRHVLSPKDEIELARERANARRKGREIQVEGYVRLSGTMIQSDYGRRLARWRDLERAALRLCSDVDRRGKLAGDKDRARYTMTLLADLFGVCV